MPAGTLSSGDSGRLLAIFLGLVSASILPTVSLILGSMTASGRSVKALNALHQEFVRAMDALFLLFGLIAVAIVTLFAASLPLPDLVKKIPHIAEIEGRPLQGLVTAACTMVVLKAGQVPGILRRSMAIRHEIAVDEARRRTMERAPSTSAVGSSFATHPDFGKGVEIQDLRSSSDPH